MAKDKKGRVGFRRLDGSWQIPPRFDSVTQFVNGRAFVREGLGGKGKCGIIDRDGRWLREFPRRVQAFCSEVAEGIVGVYLGGNCGLMNLEGQLLCEGPWHLRDNKVFRGVIVALNPTNKNYGLLDLSGRWIVKPVFDEFVTRIGPFAVFQRRLFDQSTTVVFNSSGKMLWDCGEG